MTYIMVDCSLLHSRKAWKAARKLGIPVLNQTEVPNEMVGLLSRFWAWVMQVFPDGRLDAHIDETDIADACGWHGDSQLLVSVLLETHFLDRDGNSLRVHDWEQYSGRIVKSQAANRARQTAYRSRHANDPEPTTGKGQPAQFATPEAPTPAEAPAPPEGAPQATFGKPLSRTPRHKKPAQDRPFPTPRRLQTLPRLKEYYPDWYAAACEMSDLKDGPIFDKDIKQWFVHFEELISKGVTLDEFKDLGKYYAATVPAHLPKTIRAICSSERLAAVRSQRNPTLFTTTQTQKEQTANGSRRSNNQAPLYRGPNPTAPTDESLATIEALFGGQSYNPKGVAAG